MERQAFGFLSADQRTEIHAVRWKPEGGEVKGILQISHGMVEHIERYGEFAGFMAQRGFLTVGHDHLGHGESIRSEKYYGYFARKNGSDILVEDMQQVRVIAQQEHPGAPYFILGHSMGSFLLRKYLAKYGDGLAGALILGTGTQPDSLMRVGKVLCRILAAFQGWKHQSKFVNDLIFSGGSEKVKSEGQEEWADSWVTKDVEIAKKYENDPKCQFCFTLNGFYNLFQTVRDVNRKEKIQAIPKDLPMIFLSGVEDPVGNYGKGVEEAYACYREAGIRDISMKLYPGDRHEILNEIDRETVYQDIYAWIQARMERRES